MNISLPIEHKVGKSSRIPTEGMVDEQFPKQKRYVCLRMTCNSEFQEPNVFLFVCVETDVAKSD